MVLEIISPERIKRLLALISCVNKGFISMDKSYSHGGSDDVFITSEKGQLRLKLF